jgi:tetratricopeptide (TPR) repeat protein
VSLNPFTAIQQKATALAEKGQEDAAITLLESLVGPPLIASDSESQEAQHYLASLYNQQKHYGEAELVCQNLLNNPTSSLLAFNTSQLLATVLENQGFIAEAEEAQNRRDAIVPSIESPVDRALATAFCFRQRKKFTSAYEAQKLALGLIPEKQTETQIAECEATAAEDARNAGLYLDAIYHGGRAALINGSYVDRLRGAIEVANSQLARQEWDGARDWAAECLHLARGTRKQLALHATITSGFLLFNLGRITDAIDLADDVIRADDAIQFDALYLKFHCLLVQENYTAAESILTQLADQQAKQPASIRNQNHVLRHRLRVMLAIATKDAESALALLDLPGVESEFEHRTLRATALAVSGQHDEANELLVMLAPLADSPQKKRSHVAASRKAAVWRGDHEAIINFAKECLRVGTAPVYEPQIWLDLGDAYSAQGEVGAAQFSWNKAADHKAETAAVEKAKQRLSMPEM